MEGDQSRMGNRRYSRTGSIVIFIVVILVLSIFMKPTEAVSFSFEDEGFTIETASGSSVAVAWDALISYEVRETLDLGTMRDGTDTKEEQSGTWENDEFGVYTLCTDAGVKCYLILYLEDGVVVTNFESVEGTQSLGEAIGEMLSDMS